MAAPQIGDILKDENGGMEFKVVQVVPAAAQGFYFLFVQEE